MRTDNWLDGRRILDKQEGSLAICRRQCQEDDRCAGFDWFAAEASGICRHYEHVERQSAKAGWRSGVRRKHDSTKAMTGSPSVSPPTGLDTGFVSRLDLRVVGERIEASSTRDCEAACRVAPGCVAYSRSVRHQACELYSRVERLAEDRGWRAGVRADVYNAYNAQLASKAASAGVTPIPKADPIPPVAAIPPVEPKARGFDGASSGISLDENVRVDGNALGEPARATSPDACRQRCAETAGCVGFRHGKKVPMMGQCQLFDRVDRRQEDLSWRSGVAGAR